MFRYYLKISFSLLILFSSCKVKQAFEIREKCISQLMIPEDTSITPVKVFISIDKIKFNRRKYDIKKDTILDIRNESGLIMLNSDFAVKVFHMQGTEYGKIQHYIRWDFLIRTKTCWTSVIEGSLDPWVFEDSKPDKIKLEWAKTWIIHTSAQIKCKIDYTIIAWQ